MACDYRGCTCRFGGEIMKRSAWHRLWNGRAEKRAKDIEHTANLLILAEKANDQEFLEKLKDEELKKFYVAQAAEGKDILRRLDLIGKEMTKRGMV